MSKTRGKKRSPGTLARIAAALACVFSTAALATPPLSVQRYSLEEGLSQQAVNAIVQDSEGFMWFGTEDGLNRFDGYEFRQLRHDRGDSETLPNGWISSLVASDEGLWISTDGGGVVFRSALTGKLDAPALLRDAPDLQRVRSLARDRLGRLWIASRDAGVAIYDVRSNELHRVRHSPKLPNSLSDNSVFSLIHLRNGETLVGTASGLDRLTAANHDVSRIPLPPELAPAGQPLRVRALTESTDGTVWVGTDAGLGRYDARNGRWRVFKEIPAGAPGHDTALPDNRIQSLLIDSQGRLWIGMIRGLSWFDSATESFSNYRRDEAEARSLPDDYVISLAEDRGGSLWIGTKFGGLAKWNPRTWSFGHVRASAEEGYSDRNIISFAEDKLGRLWIGTFGSGINLLDRSTGKVSHIRHVNGVRTSLSDERVMAMLESSAGDMWVGTMGGGLNRFDPRTLKAEVFQHDADVPTSLGAAGVMSLLEVDKQLWVGTFGGGISRFDARTRRFDNLRAGPEDGLHLSSGRVTALTRDRAGHVWIGTDGGGLNVWDQKTRRLYYYRRGAKQLDTLSADTIYSILVDDTGGVWIGTRGGGLDRVLNPAEAPHGLRFANISEAQGLPNNTIYGLRADGTGNIWISTNFGLARLDPRTQVIQRFHRLHGLQAEEFNFGAHYRDRSGKLFFGGAAGFNSFYPEVLEFNERPPRVVLTQFLKLNTPGIVGVPEERIERLDLSHKEDVITLKFAALDFADSRSNRYEYMLDGFDSDWVRADERRAATYTNLPGGQYVFRVRASNSDGVWSTEDLALPIDVAPSPWLSPFAFLGYALLAVFMLLAVWYAQQRRIARAAMHRLELEQQVSDRTYELAQRNRELEDANRRLEMASLSDPLTGLANRRYLMQQFPRLIGDRRATSGLAVMIIDLDALKPINDQHGHAAGDEVIVEIAKTLRQAIRPDDVLARWGGDEFVVVAQAQHVEHACMLAERVRERIAKMKCVLPRGAVVRTSCSIGLTCLPFVPGNPEAVSWEHAIKIADLALYRAKRGRNAWRGWFGTERVATLQSVISAVESNVDGLIANGVIIEQMSTRGSDDTVNALRVLREAR
ncbi:MAG TPA: two-component regulator propeller domain-containing protein [Steroidobacteraceae bacterium]|nr:two-component regulator propeller domain-containing protein [Steroidobacteraceae bacterium]